MFDFITMRAHGRRAEWSQTVELGWILIVLGAFLVGVSVVTYTRKANVAERPSRRARPQVGLPFVISIEAGFLVVFGLLLLLL